jgi:hypothetical protein
VISKTRRVVLIWVKVNKDGLCCVKVSGNKQCVGEMISELLALFLPEEMQLLYRQRRCSRPITCLGRCGCHRHAISCFSWSCSAEPFQLAPVQLRCETPRMTTRTRPCSPQDGWRDLKWDFLNRFSAASHNDVNSAVPVLLRGGLRLLSNF